MRPVLVLFLVALLACQAESPKAPLKAKPAQGLAPVSSAVPILSPATIQPAPSLQALVKRLYRVAKDQRRAEPKIFISIDRSCVASCKPRENQIILEAQALEICRQFGPDSTALLGFIIGHEMGHLLAHRSTVQSTRRCWGYYRQPQTPEAVEGNADLYGLFLCKLAGLDQAQKQLPQLIEKLYHNYHFEAKLPGYPSKKERQEYAQWIGLKTDSLWQVWESGLFLMGLRQYAAASACFEYIAQYYQGAEVWHNWGTAAALAAIQLQNRQQATPYYPLLAAGQLRLEVFRGPLSSAEASQLSTWLYQAKTAMLLAHAQRPQHLVSVLNLLMIHLLNQEIVSAEQLLARHCNGLTATQLLFFQTLIDFHRGNHDVACRTTFGGLSQAEDAHLAFAAAQNYQLLSGQELNLAPESCSNPDFYPDQLQPRMLNIPSQYFFDLNEHYQLAWKSLPQSMLIKLRAVDQSTESGLQIVHQPAPSPFKNFKGVGGIWTPTSQAQRLTEDASYHYWWALPCQPAVKTNRRQQIAAWAILLPVGW